MNGSTNIFRKRIQTRYTRSFHKYRRGVEMNVYFGALAQIFRMFWFVVLFSIVGLAYIFFSERRDKQCSK